ncbi:MAG TPA: sigma-70 family RNA polymerase sigma factor [Gemmatimonadales bacterium]|nr:sigma-70 family RNA polymerase sigma factor [Gemmatimonadales bacterium]
MSLQFDEDFERLFRTELPRLFRYLDRLSGEPDLAADLVQEAFVRLHRRGEMPERPQLWLVTVALNLFRNARSTDSRRRRLLTGWAGSLSPPASPTGIEEGESPSRVRAALKRLPSRDREMLLLRAEGYSYREISEALELREASVGTLLARAKRAFREVYEG